MDLLVRRVERILALASISDDALSSATMVVCEQCVNKVVHESKRLYGEMEREREVVLKALKTLEEERDGGESPADSAEQESALLQRELALLHEEERRLQMEYDDLRTQLGELQTEEAQYWEDMRAYQLDIVNHEEEMAMVERLTEYASNQLKRLQDTNVTNDVFHITNEGPFGAINNFRLGKLPDQTVGWDEINVAWGQACLLLDVILKRLRIPMETFPFRLAPRGSYSSIVRIQDNQVYELYGSDGGLSRFFPFGRRFDSAMSFFLQCMEEVVRWLHRRDPNVRLPFKIESANATVGEFSVRLQFNEYERWTKALKFMLIDLKWMIAFMEANLK
eukprot:GEMP01035117.1.p1 GENE.GEMP01035117.1~~GEMP01035117.1.p1  ORF type:complete len:335 (+),score=92.25 GEMP01035117.1:276-1280(+)